MQQPASLEAQTRPNLKKLLKDLIPVTSLSRLFLSLSLSLSFIHFLCESI
jgi:hypothetical protein